MARERCPCRTCTLTSAQPGRGWNTCTLRTWGRIVRSRCGAGASGPGSAPAGRGPGRPGRWSSAAAGRRGRSPPSTSTVACANRAAHACTSRCSRDPPPLITRQVGRRGAHRRAGRGRGPGCPARRRPARPPGRSPDAASRVTVASPPLGAGGRRAGTGTYGVGSRAGCSWVFLSVGSSGSGHREPGPGEDQVRVVADPGGLARCSRCHAVTRVRGSGPRPAAGRRRSTRASRRAARRTAAGRTATLRDGCTAPCPSPGRGARDPLTPGSRPTPGRCPPGRRARVPAAVAPTASPSAAATRSRPVVGHARVTSRSRPATTAAAAARARRTGRARTTRAEVASSQAVQPSSATAQPPESTRPAAARASAAGPRGGSAPATASSGGPASDHAPRAPTRHPAAGDGGAEGRRERRRRVTTADLFV